MRRSHSISPPISDICDTGKSGKSGYGSGKSGKSGNGSGKSGKSGSHYSVR